MDRLQNKIRKMKNPLVVDFGMLDGDIPPQILESQPSFSSAWEFYCKELLQELKDSACAARFSMNMASVYGSDGMVALAELLRYAKSLGYYVLLDGPASLNAQDTERSAKVLFDTSCGLQFDGLIVTAYIGSDGIRPYATRLAENDKEMFVVLRTANRSAQDLQDLRTGARLVHTAAADILGRFATEQGKSGYTRLGGLGAANDASSLLNLRTKYKNLFLLVDGYEAAGSNAKNCSNAFDRFGHGAAVCAGTEITAAWQSENRKKEEYLAAAKESAQRICKNIARYITIL